MVIKYYIQKYAAGKTSCFHKIREPPHNSIGNSHLNTIIYHIIATITRIFNIRILCWSSVLAIKGRLVHFNIGNQLFRRTKICCRQINHGA